MRFVQTVVAALVTLVGASALAQSGSQLVPQLRPDTEATSQPAPPRPVTNKSGAPELTASDVDAWLDGFMPNALAMGDIAGAVVVVVKDGQILSKHGYGYADVAKRTPVDPDTTMFRPGSVSKLVTWTAVMQEVEKGKIDLDADVNTYLDFKIPAWNGQPMTMRQLMTHTAGFEEHAKFLLSEDPKSLHSLGDYLKIWVPNRIFAPGTTPAYSNYATSLAGYIVERVSGQSFDDYVDQNIFTPLGMRHSTFRQPLPARFAPFMSKGYMLGSGEPVKYELVDPAPAGALAASGTDMARFMLAHLQGGELDGKRILSAATAKEMHDTPTTFLPPLNRMELGFFETNINGRQVIGHLGDLQAFHTALHLFVNENVGLYVAVNSAGKAGAAGAVRLALFQNFADRYFPAPTTTQTRVDPKTAAEHARMMAGNWRASRRIETGFLNVSQLIGQATVGVGPKGDLVIPSIKTPGGAVRHWTEVSPFVWQAVGGHDRLAAKVVDGRVVRWSYDFASPFQVWDRVPALQSASWLLPALYVSLAILLVAFLQWPAAALVRRRYKATMSHEGRSRQVYRGVRLASGLVLAMLIAWGVAFTWLSSTAANLGASSDPLLWTLQILGLIVFVAAVLLAAWNVWLAWRGGRRWTAKLGAVMILLASAVVLYVMATFGLLDMTVNY